MDSDRLREQGVRIHAEAAHDEAGNPGTGP